MSRTSILFLISTASLPLTAMSALAAGVSVSSPVNGAKVSTSFNLKAISTSCSSQSVTAMGYSFDNSSKATIIKGTSINAAIKAPSTGSHVLHVKSWGNKGAGCATPVMITVVQPVNGVTVNAPASGAKVSNPFLLNASSVSCQGQKVGSMGYSFDNSSNTTVIHAESIDQMVSASSVSAGNHVLHVKSWGTSGAACVAAVSIAIGEATPGPTPAPTSTPKPSPSSVSGSGPSIPDNANVAADIDSASGMNWEFNHDPGTPGSSSGTSVVLSTFDGKDNVRRYSMSYQSGGGEIYHLSFAKDANATHFVYDTYVYVNNPADLGNLEMDMNQVIPNGDTVIYGFQCDGYSKTWAYTYVTESNGKYSPHWAHSKAECNPRAWSANTWHHVQIAYSRDASGNVTYEAAYLDGVESPIHATVNSADPLHWGAATLLTNFQIDGLGSGGAITAYTSGMTIYYW